MDDGTEQWSYCWVLPDELDAHSVKGWHLPYASCWGESNIFWWNGRLLMERELNPRIHYSRGMNYVVAVPIFHLDRFSEDEAHQIIAELRSRGKKMDIYFRVEDEPYPHFNMFFIWCAVEGEDRNDAFFTACREVGQVLDDMNLPS